MNGWCLGADGSHWSGAINFETMYNAGARFYIGKATDSYRGGFKFEDDHFNRHFEQSFRLGQLLNGCFHWLQPDVDPKDAAEFYLERYTRFPFHFPPVLDFEEPYVYQNNLQSHYCWCAQVWLDTIKSHTGRTPIIYTAKWYTSYFKDKHISWMKAYPLWVAQYPSIMFPWSRPSLPSAWDNWTIWQFSADKNKRGNEFGAEADDMDLNYYQGSYEELLAWLDTDEPQPTDPPVSEDGMWSIEMLGNMSIRDEPSVTEGTVVAYALRGQTYYATEERNGWFRIDKGWLSGLTQYTKITEIEDVTPPEPPEPPDKTLEERVSILEKKVEALEQKG